MVNYVVYPLSQEVLVNPALLQSVYDKNVKLRVTPVGNFIGYQGVIEYFYGLSLAYRIPAVYVTKIICSGNIVALQANNLFPSSLPGSNPYPGPFNLTLMAFLTFDEKTALVKSLEVSLLNFGEAFDRSDTINPLTGINNHLESIAEVCAITVYGRLNTTVFNPLGGTCMGKTRIWGNSFGLSDYDYCFAFLSGKVPSPLTGAPLPYGSYNRLNSNTVLCRLTHALLSIYNSTLHCPHVSPTGGMACVDFSYHSFYEDTF